jgi:hypothetical protein
MNRFRPQVDIMIKELVMRVKRRVRRRCLGEKLAIVGSRAKDGYLHGLRRTLNANYRSKRLKEREPADLVAEEKLTDHFSG